MRLNFFLCLADIVSWTRQKFLNTGGFYVDLAKGVQQSGQHWSVVYLIWALTSVFCQYTGNVWRLCMEDTESLPCTPCYFSISILCHLSCS